MGLFKVAMTKVLKSLIGADPWADSSYGAVGGKTVSGVTVNADTALSYSAFWCGIQVYCAIAAMPLVLYRKKENESQEMPGIPLYRVLKKQANPHMTALNCRSTLIADALINGTGYAEKLYNPKGELAGLLPILSKRVTPDFDRESQQFYYEIEIGGETVVLPDNKIFKLPLLGDGFFGLPLAEYAKETIGAALATEQFGAAYFGNGTTPSIAIKHPGKLSDQASKRLMSSMTANYSGLSNAHRLMLLEEGMDTKNISIPPETAQFIQTRIHSVQDMARFFNLNPHKLKDLSYTANGSMEELNLDHYKESLLPLATRFEQEIDRQLLTEKQKQAGFYCKHKFGQLLRADTEKRYKAYATGKQWGFLSTNDIRAMEDLNPIEGGDVYYVPLNMVEMNGSTFDSPDGLELKAFNPMIKDAFMRTVNRETLGAERLLKAACKQGEPVEKFKSKLPDFYNWLETYVTGNFQAVFDGIRSGTGIDLELSRFTDRFIEKRLAVLGECQSYEELSRAIMGFRKTEIKQIPDNRLDIV